MARMEAVVTRCRLLSRNMEKQFFLMYNVSYNEELVLPEECSFGEITKNGTTLHDGVIYTIQNGMSSAIYMDGNLPCGFNTG
jgi:hypothetical protein